MTLDATMRDLASNLLEEFGGSATLIRTDKFFDRVASKEYVKSVTQYSVKIQPPVPAESEGEAFDRVMETLIAAKDISIVPQAETDELLFDNETWNILHVERIYSGDLVAAFLLRMGR